MRRVCEQGTAHFSHGEIGTRPNLLAMGETRQGLSTTAISDYKWTLSTAVHPRQGDFILCLLSKCHTDTQVVAGVFAAESPNPRPSVVVVIGGGAQQPPTHDHSEPNC